MYAIRSYYAFLLLVSCHKDVKNDYQAEHDKMMANFKTEYGITESDKIDDGLYLKFTHQVNLDSSTALYPNGTSDVIVDLLGFLGSQGVFEATNYQDANDNGIYSEQYVYGPKRLDIRSLPLGLGVALLSMQEGESAIVLMDHRLRITSYNVCYTKLLRNRTIPGYLSPDTNPLHITPVCNHQMPDDDP